MATHGSCHALSIMHLLSSTLAYCIKHPPQKGRFLSVLFLVKLLMILHTDTDFPLYDQIDQSIDKWEFIIWTPALGKGKEDWILAIWFDLFCCIIMMNIRKVTFNDSDVFPVWQGEMMSAYVLMGWLCTTSRQGLGNLSLKRGERIWGVLFLGLQFFME